MNGKAGASQLMSCFSNLAVPDMMVALEKKIETIGIIGII